MLSIRNQHESAPNETTRVTMELHTLGVDGGYTPRVIELAAASPAGTSRIFLARRFCLQGRPA